MLKVGRRMSCASVIRVANSATALSRGNPVTVGPLQMRERGQEGTSVPW